MLMKYPTMELIQDLEKYCRVVFSRALAVRRSQEKIFRIQNAQGQEVDEPQQVEDEIIGCYSDLLGQSLRGNHDILPDFRTYSKRRLNDANHMIRPFLASDIKDVLFSFSDDKAPESD
ncbi:hypothetical protein BUALT_Bualt01G0136900 [Buddleja alternifolia]|uniref:Uncharacterized protein n=1 Tax=Buddleja alternifolia TaxID=168488 RepID=A0AAV6Y6X4_9LAMI|nr:hypothetical protein BUALT_Bualt01G0136900 [Buddleja alternifolia]